MTIKALITSLETLQAVYGNSIGVFAVNPLSGEWLEVVDAEAENSEEVIIGLKEVPVVLEGN